MKINNKELIQSYLVTTAKYDFNVHEKRVLYRIVEAIQYEIAGKKLDKTFIVDDLYGDKTVRIPIKSFLNGENDKNHALAKKALISLRSKHIELTETSKDNKKVWRVFGVIEKPKIHMYDEIAEFTIDKEIYNALFNFAKGHRKYELKTAFEFDSVYTMRFYELFSNQKRVITYSIEWLKERFGLQEKYINRPADFIHYVVAVAQKELDKKSPYSFEYIALKEGRKTVSIRFTPKYIPKNQDDDLEKKKLLKKASPRWLIDKNVIEALKIKFGFTDKEIQNNLPLFESAESKLDDFLMFITTKHAKSAHLDTYRAKGWFINAVKGELELLN